MGVNDSARLLLTRLIKLALGIAVVYGAVWSYFNWDYILEKFGAKYEVSRYGIIWNTNLSAAKRTAAKYNRNIMIVYIRSGAKHDASEYLISRIFPSTQFRKATETYIPLLIDASGGPEESARTKQNRDEIVKAYSRQKPRKKACYGFPRFGGAVSVSAAVLAFIVMLAVFGRHGMLKRGGLFMQPFACVLRTAFVCIFL